MPCINRTFNYAKRKGTLIVVSAGNAAEDLDHNGNEFAAYCDAPHVICVSALGPTGEGAFGPFVNVERSRRPTAIRAVGHQRGRARRQRDPRCPGKSSI